MLSVVRAVTFCILLVTPGTKADFSCICNYAVEQHLYRDPDVASTVIGSVYEFDCKPIYTGGSKAKAGWNAIISDHQIGYMQDSSTLQVQTCPGSPQFKDTVTTGPSTTSTTTQSSTTTSTTPTTTTASTTTTSRTVPTTTTASTTTTSPTVPTTRASTASSVPASTQSSHAAIQNATINISRPTMSRSTTHAPTTHTPKLQTTHRPHAHGTQSHVQTTRIPHAQPTTKAPQPVAHVTATYTCPQNVISAASYNRGATTVYGNICYELVPGQNTWHAAEANCNNKGGYLIHVASFAEETAIMRFLQSHRFDSYPFWTGLNDIGHEQYFTWTNGDPVTYTKWLSFHTNHFNHHSVEDCVVLVPYVKEGGLFHTYGVWDDVYCNKAYPWVCQYDAVPHTGSSHTTVSPAQQLFHNLFGLIG